MGQSITEKTAKIKCNLAKLIINDSQNFVVEKKQKKKWRREWRIFGALDCAKKSAPEL